MVKPDILFSDRKWYLINVVFIFALLISSYGEVSSQALACNDNVQVSLNQDCEATITPGMILEGEDEDLLPNYSVDIGGVSGTTVTSPGFYSVTVTDNTNGNYCWGNITVEDKLAPMIEDCACPVGNDLPECQFLCTDLDGLLANTIVVPQPVVQENCSSYVSEYSDVVTEGGCGEKIITRSWLFTDNAGNTATGCVQEFRTLPVSSSDIVEPQSPIELTCGADVSMLGIVAYFTPIVGAEDAITYGYPTANGVALNGAICNLVASKTDLVIPVCDQSCSNSIKVIRDWTILDWCTAEITSFNQIVKAVDNEDPTIEAADQTVSTDPWVCAGNFYLDAPEILHDNCTDYVTYTVTGPAGIVITWDAQANRYFATGVPKGMHSFQYIASDCCGNTSTDPVIVTVVDQTAPVAIAKQNIVVSLTQSANSSGTAKVFAPSVDNGSHDGCTNVHLEIRRDNDECNEVGNDTYNNDGHSFDSNNDTDNGQWVKFCCEDLDNAEVDVDGDGVLDPGYVKVWLRVWDDGDMNGQFGSSGDNFNETWAFVKVEDKLGAIINCPADITIACDDDPLDLGVTGEATGSMTCGPAEVTFEDIVNNVDQCGVGTIRRRWSIVGEPSVFCDQFITKSEGDLFNGNITWPSDYTTDCTDIANNNDMPTWNNPGCSQLGYNLESDTFQFEEDACFKIINYWTVIDWCQYDANGTSNEGMWNYTQVIKVVDDVAPVMECSPQMYAVDDYTDADNDGDQCESLALMLTNSADDNGDCASAWLKWTVLVDLWGDGTYDYEYSSNLPIFDSNFNDTNGNGIPDIYLAPTSSGEEVKVTLPEDIPGSMSNHKVRWSVSDGCQNNTSCENTFMVVDKKAPTPYCIDVSTAVMENGMLELWACDFDLGSFDNCTEDTNLRFTFTQVAPENDPKYNEDTGCSSKIFDCDDVTGEPIPVEMYVWDEKGNFDFCEVMLTLIDNQGGCDQGNGMRISGAVKSSSAELLDEVEVTLIAPSIDMVKYDMTNEEGGYSFFNNPDAINYNVSASFEGNYLDGVSTLDLVMIQRHVLGLQSFENAYQTIAGDVNNDEKLSATDLLQLRKLILGVFTELPDHKSYVLIDGTETYDDAADPWPVDTEITINALAHDMADQDFVAIKIGDVNQSAEYGQLVDNEATVRNEKSLNLEAVVHEGYDEEKSVVEIISKSDIDLVGFQMSLDITGLDNIKVVSNAVNLKESNYTIKGNTLNLSWTSLNAIAISNSEALFTISGDKNMNIEANVNDRSTLLAEAYDVNLKTYPVELTVKRADSITEVFVVSQNEPNPFSDVTVINFNVLQGRDVSIIVSDITGKVLINKSVDSIRGNNQFTVRSSDLNQSGVYYYTLTAGDKSITNKMVLIK